MKKVLAMFLVCAMALSLSAKSKTTLLFNRKQFQTSQADCSYLGLPALTVPLVYSGTLALDGKIAWDNDDTIYEKCQIGLAPACNGDVATYGYIYNPIAHVALEGPHGVEDSHDPYYCYIADYSAKLPIYMTICQPCIDCYPCTVLGQYNGVTFLYNEESNPLAVGFSKEAFVGKITRWNLYIALVNKKAKSVWIEKISMLDEAVDPVFSELNSVFFTGGFKNAKSASSNAQSGGKAYVQAKGDYFGALAMTGTKNDYKFKYTDAWLDDDMQWHTFGGTATAYIKSVSKFDGLFCFSRMFGWDADGENLYGFQFCGDVTLTRNASLTKAAITTTFTATVTTSSGNNWEDCFVDTPADYCEEYFSQEWGDKFDAYLENKAYKGYDFDWCQCNDMYAILGDVVDLTIGTSSVYFDEEVAAYDYTYGGSSSEIEE